jgi:hypothetical protein
MIGVNHCLLTSGFDGFDHSNNLKTETKDDDNEEWPIDEDELSRQEYLAEHNDDLVTEEDELAHEEFCKMMEEDLSEYLPDKNNLY